MRLLDLFCGAGGAGMGYHRAGFEVVGVDINPQPHYPFEFHQADALEYLAAHGHEFDAIHASPPCQGYTRKPKNWGRKRVSEIVHPDLLDETRELLKHTGKPYVLENVPGSPIRAQLFLCGSMFGLKIQKHRYFESNIALPFAPATCNHVGLFNPWEGEGRTADKFREAQGTPWIPAGGGASRKAGVTGDLYNAIPPAYTEFIGRQLLGVLQP